MKDKLDIDTAKLLFNLNCDFGELYVFYKEYLFWFVVKKNYNYEHHEEGFIQFDDLSIQDFYEELEDVCGTRKQRTALEKENHITKANRHLPPEEKPKLKRRVKLRKRREGFTKVIAQVTARNDAVLDIRESRYSNSPEYMYLVIEENSEDSLIEESETLIEYLKMNDDDDDDDNDLDAIKVAVLDVFQVIHIIEILYPFLPSRDLYTDRALVRHLRTTES